MNNSSEDSIVIDNAELVTDDQVQVLLFQYQQDNENGCNIELESFDISKYHGLQYHQDHVAILKLESLF